jgi:hypothetical protein
MMGLAPAADGQATARRAGKKGRPMGKGNRNRKKRPAGKVSATPRQDPMITRLIAGYEQHLTARQQVGGWNVLAAYLAYMARAAREIESDLATMQLRANAPLSAEDNELIARMDHAKRAIPDHVRYEEHRREAAESIALIAENDMVMAVTAIRIAPLRFGPVLSGWPPDTAEWRRGALPIVTAVSDPGLLDHAAAIMDRRLALYDPAADADEVDAYTGAADQSWAAALHAEAALAAWLVWESGLVTEPASAYLRISEAVLAAYGEEFPQAPS